MLDTSVVITNREKEILEHMIDGYSNKAIAYQLGIKERTVKAHMQNMMEKLEAHNRTHVLVKAVRLGVVQI